MEPGMSGEADPPLLDVRSLRVSFRRNDCRVRAVNGLSFRIHAGHTLAIVGESGSGKSVSCRAITGLLPATASVSGSVIFDGTDLLGLNERQMRAFRGNGVAMVFQDPARALNPTMRVGHQIVEDVRQHEPVDRDGARKRAIELLDRLRVPEPSQRFSAWPHELSGGLRQRVMIAIALAGRPRLLVADEATRSLDALVQNDTLALLKDLQRELGMALILISHDLSLASDHADEVLVMYAGRAVEQAPVRKVFRQSRMRYTRALLGSALRIDSAPHAPIAAIDGDPPDPTHLPQGCAFESRCRGALPICKTLRPPFEEQERNHAWACWNPAREEDGV
jgi:oligopeptide/dipeptide ABC transporter ATP-binding protein